MPLTDEDRPRRPAAPQPGENLADLSVAELTERIRLYREEIERIEHDIEAKQKHRVAADSIFRR